MNITDYKIPIILDGINDSPDLKNNINNVWTNSIRPLVMLNFNSYKNNVNIIPVDGYKKINDVARVLVFLINGMDKDISELEIIVKFFMETGDTKKFLFELDSKRYGKFEKESATIVYFDIPIIEGISIKDWEYDIVFFQEKERKQRRF